MEQIEGKRLTTERGEQVVFKFELIPSDMKWMSSHSLLLTFCQCQSNKQGNHWWFYWWP